MLVVYHKVSLPQAERSGTLPEPELYTQTRSDTRAHHRSFLFTRWPQTILGGNFTVYLSNFEWSNKDTQLI